MDQKAIYYPSPLSQSVPESTSQVPASDHHAAEEAYRIFRRYQGHPKNTDIKITYENRAVDLKFLGSGGSKLVYAINDDYAVALYNTSNLTDIPLWHQIIQEETMFSQRLRNAGLYTQHYEVATLSFNGYETKVIKMPTFSSLTNKGLQIRDVKNASDSQYGTSMLFGNLTNLQSKDHWQKLLQGFSNDLVAYYREGLVFASDTFNLVVADTHDTPVHDRSAFGLFTERSQSVHFCFYDFYEKGGSYSEIKYPFLNSAGEIVRDAIEAQVNFLFDKVLSAITVSVLPIECVNILGGYDILLTSNTPETIPSTTIVLQRKANTINAYFVNTVGKIESKELDILALDRNLYSQFEALDFFESEGIITKSQADTGKTRLLESSETLKLFPESGHTKITVSENKKLVEKVVRLCGCHQYSTVNYALNISALAKTTLENVKPWFVNVVTNNLIAELEQLPVEVRQARFGVYGRSIQKTEEKPVVSNHYQPC